MEEHSQLFIWPLNYRVPQTWKVGVDEQILYYTYELKNIAFWCCITVFHQQLNFIGQQAKIPQHCCLATNTGAVWSYKCPIEPQLAQLTLTLC